MTTYTEEDLATRVLRDLGLVGAEETPTAADLQWAIETNASVIAMLSVIGIPIWNGSEIEVPQEYLVPLSKRLGLDVATAFGLVDPATAEAAKRELERVLTMMASPRGAVNPIAIKTNDAQPSRALFNYTTGR